MVARVQAKSFKWQQSFNTFPTIPLKGQTDFPTINTIQWGEKIREHVNTKYHRICTPPPPETNASVKTVKTEQTAYGFAVGTLANRLLRCEFQSLELTVQ